MQAAAGNTTVTQETTAGGSVSSPSAPVRIDINAIPEGSDPGNYTLGNGQMFFTARDNVHGRELWVTDGTATGTQMVKDIYPGLKSSSIGNMIILNGKLLFTANDGVNGKELWLSDGTANGTTLLKEFTPNSTMYPWFGNFAVFNGTAYFQALSDTSVGRELWKTDGTEAGTVMVKEINPGTSGSYPSQFTNCGSGRRPCLLHRRGRRL
ncbi:MAG TPA: hypothetical protein EYP41_04735 [Anaerolineae bacterium]|nr:hypothetical protein [Anaerolineae bacterium]HIP69863.1 hypothetical protein [Anaerolineae bacterium]